MNENKKIKSIVILGGGSAGWMVASALSKIIGTNQFNITLVESESIGTVSVGEATIPQIRAFNEMIGIDENDFLKFTQGTFKQGIEFRNWRDKGHAYMHPFGPYGNNLGGVPFHHYWLKQQIENSPNNSSQSFSDKAYTDDLLDYCYEGVAAKNNRFTRPVNVPNTPMYSVNYAFHFDATLYAKYLRQFSEKLGVKRIEGLVKDVKRNSDSGFIKSLEIKTSKENEQSISGDLFIDCSGFKGVLIENVMNSGFEDWRHWLPCDSAVAQASESINEIKPYTVSTAHQSGWQWEIPLQSRIGNGNVFSSRYMSKDDAVKHLHENIPSEKIGEPRFLHWVNGKRRKSWIKNCVAIGLSAGFLEPLESTGLQLIQASINRLLSLFPNKEFRQADIDAFNRFADTEIKQIRDFIILHYKVTNRTDSAFWNYCREMEIPDTLKEKIELYKANGRIFRDGYELFSDISWLSVLNGQGLKTNGYHAMADLMPSNELDSQLEKMKNVISECQKKTPTHRAYINKYCKS